MKKMIASLAAVALFAAPALAELTTNRITIPKGAYSVTPFLGESAGDTRGAPDIYDNTTFGPPSYGTNNAGKFVGDDLHMTGTTITSFRWVYDDGGPVSHSSSVAFFYNTAADGAPGPLLGNTVTFVQSSITYGAVFNVTGLPQATVNNPNGGWLISITVPALLTGPDAWVGLNSTSTTPTSATVGPNQRRGLRGGGVHTEGSSHNLAWSGFFAPPPTTVFFAGTGTQTGNYRMAVGGVPEPAAAALLAIGGLLALRRRRA